MQINPSKIYQKETETISAIRQCVHCGMCNATCPTYQVLGDELDGPRGRIYLIKQILEGSSATVATRRHLDQCLTCRSCETTCPSSVPYGRLLDEGRKIVDKDLAERGNERSINERFIRAALMNMLTSPHLLRAIIFLAQVTRPFLPRSIRRKIPVYKPDQNSISISISDETDWILHKGCVQDVISPLTNGAISRVFKHVGLQVNSSNNAGCCGAIKFHLGDEEGARQEMRKNLDAWKPLLKSGAKGIVSASSGCAKMLSEYGHILRNDPEYAELARLVSENVRDPSQVLTTRLHDFPEVVPLGASQPTISFHSPCTLQHGLKVKGQVEKVLSAVGFSSTVCKDSHFCCGSAGTYSVLHPKIANRLREKKLAALESQGIGCIVTANIGCQLHLQGGTDTPVRHWIELIDERLQCQSINNRDMPAIT